MVTNPTYQDVVALINKLQGSYTTLADTDKLISLKEAAENSLLEFTKQAWPIIEGGRTFHSNWHIEAECEHLEAFFYGHIKNLLLNFPPRTCKTTIVSVTFPAWVWLKRPETQFLCVANQADLVLEGATKSRDIIESEWYQGNWGHLFTLKDDENAKTRFKNDKTGYRISRGILSGITGKGGEIIIIDDPNNAFESDVESENILTTFKSTLSSRQNTPGFGGFILMQQRTKERDLSGYALEHEKDKWVKVILPMEYDPARKCRTIILPSANGKVWEDPRTKPGELLWPQFRTRDWVEDLKARMADSYLISGQLQQLPSPAEGGIIKKAWFKKWTKANRPPIKKIIQSWDTAMMSGKESKNGQDTTSYSVCTTWGLFQSEDEIFNLILLGMWRGRVEYPELREMAKRLYKDYRNDGSVELAKTTGYRPDMVLVEAKASGTSLLQDFRKAGILATGFNPTPYGDKMARVRLVTHYIEGGCLWLPTMPTDCKKLKPFAETFLQQVALFPKGESRDIVDTMTQVILRLTGSGWIRDPRDDVDKALKRNKAPKSFYGASAE